MIWAVSILSLVIYAGAVTWALVRARTEVGKLKPYVTALALERETRKKEKAKLIATCITYKKQLSDYRTLVRDLERELRKGEG